MLESLKNLLPFGIGLKDIYRVTDRIFSECVHFASIARMHSSRRTR